VAIYFIKPDIAALVVAFFALSCLTIDLLRIFSKGFSRAFMGVFGELLREDERSQKLTGATYLFLASLLCILYYTREVAALAVLFLILGDSAASLVGSHFGKTKIWKNKSLVGSLSCLSTCVLIAFFIPILEMRIAIIGAFVATIVELIPGRINDNLAMPIASGLAMELLLRFSSW
jgi:dolichol kinase